MKSASKLLIEEPEFEEVRRGYDRNQVNSFLERIDDAVAELQRQLTQVAERARAAEAELVARHEGAESAGTEQINRTLVLAQRTADAAIAEARELADQSLTEARTEAEQERSQAREEAAQHLGQAREEAEQHVGRARAEGDRMALEAEAHARNQRDESDRRLNAAKGEAARITEEAETEVRLRRDSAQAELLTELQELEGAREAYRGDIAILERHLEVQRTRLRIAVEEIQRLLDDPESFRIEPTPELAAQPLPAMVSDDGQSDATGDTSGNGADADVPEEPDDGAVADGGISIEAAEAAPVDSETAETAEVTDESEDAFLVELRKAMTDEEPLGARDVDENTFVRGVNRDSADDARRPRFGRRR
ncbi:MAG: DivIVA domain-containing protein [Acidimicrobiales bacterium]